MIHPFFQLLQVAIGNRDCLTRQLTAEEWAMLFSSCKKHSLIGIAFVGITRLPSEQRPERKPLAQWLFSSEKIKKKNSEMSDECVRLCRQFDSDGFYACIIKGQSNLPNYPEWLRDYRMAGDIDVLIRPKDSFKGYKGVRGSIEYCRKQCRLHNVPVGKICYHHLDMPWDGKAEVEAHHRATWLSSYFRNRTLQSWLEANMPFGTAKAIVDGDSFPIPSASFNAVYQIIHIYRHLFEEGIGLRQILDYYFVLKAYHEEGHMAEETFPLLQKFGMKEFTSALMWVLKTVFAMPDDYLLCSPDKDEGIFLLKEILQAGNFGKFDSRIKHSAKASVHNREKLKHNFHLIRHYPEEVLWEPIFRIVHFIWRQFRIWRF